jgi:hypothetical protein
MSLSRPLGGAGIASQRGTRVGLIAMAAAAMCLQTLAAGSIVQPAAGPREREFICAEASGNSRRDRRIAASRARRGRSSKGSHS